MVVNLSLVSSGVVGGVGRKKQRSEGGVLFTRLCPTREMWWWGLRRLGKDLEFSIAHYAQLMIYLPIRCPLAPTLDSRRVQGGQVSAALIDFWAGWAIRQCRGLISCLCTRRDSPSLWGKGAWLLPLASTSIVPHWHPVLCFLPTTMKPEFTHSTPLLCCVHHIWSLTRQRLLC